MSLFRIKVGDQEPAFRTTLYLGDAIFPVPSDATVRFLMAGPIHGRTAKRVGETALVIDGPNGVVAYLPASDDVDTAGVYAAEWEVTLANDDVITFPDDGYDRVVVAYDLDA